MSETEFRLKLTTLSVQKADGILYITYSLKNKIILEVRKPNRNKSDWYLMDQSVLWADFYEFIINTIFKNEKTH